jgi:hypothetical protein
VKFQENSENVKKNSKVDANLMKYKRFVLFIGNLGLHEHAAEVKKWCRVSYLYHRTKCRIQNYTIKCKKETRNNLLSLKHIFEPLVTAMRPIVEYNNSTPKKLISGDVESMISNVPFIEFFDYCKMFEFDYENFLAGYHPGLVNGVKECVQAHIIDKSTVIPFIFFNPLELVEKHIGPLIIGTGDLANANEIRLDGGKEIVIIFMDLMSSFTEYIQYLISIKNYKIQSKHYLIMNFPGQPMTVYVPKLPNDNLKMATQVDLVLGRLHERGSVNLVEDGLYFIGSGSGCSVLTDF